MAEGNLASVIPEGRRAVMISSIEENSHVILNLMKKMMWPTVGIIYQSNSFCLKFSRTSLVVFLKTFYIFQHLSKCFKLAVAQSFIIQNKFSITALKRKKHCLCP